MRFYILPRKKLGKYSIALIVIFFIFIYIFFFFVSLGERGGETFASNLKLSIPFIIAAIAGIASFITGLISTIKKEKSILVYLSMFVGLIVLIFVSGELLFPH